MFDCFTDRARKVMALARKEAQRFNHDFIGTEHMLLGLIQEEAGLAANVLRNLDIKIDTIRTQVVKRIRAGQSVVTVRQIPFTSAAKKVLELSLEEAMELAHDHIGTGHILFGLLRENNGIAAQVLLEQGLDASAIRTAALECLRLAPTLELIPVSASVPGRRSDIGLEKWARTCPDCGGSLFRDCKLWEQVCYLLPIHFFKRANHRCHDCGARFTSAWNWADVVLSLAFTLAHLALGVLAIIGLLFLAAWSLVILVATLRGKRLSGPAQVCFASLLLAMLWLFAIMAHNWAPWMFEESLGGPFGGFAILMVAGIGTAFGVLYIDKRFGAPLSRRE